MGETLRREFSLEPVDTGRAMPGTPNSLPLGSPGISNAQPGMPVTRPSFLQAFLANLGPALAGGLAAQPGQPFGSGLSGALTGIEEQKRYNQNVQLQQQTQQRLTQQAATQQQVSQAELSRLQQLTPLDVQQKQMEVDLMKGQIQFYSNPDNLRNAADSVTQSLGKLEPAERAQMDAAIQDAKLKRSFDPISNAVKTISQDRIQTARGNLDPGKQELNAYLNNPNIDKGIKKDAATFVAWKAKISPAAVVLQNLLPQGNALDQQAEVYAQTHELPAGLTRSPGTTAAIIARAAQLHPETNLAANQAQFEGDKKSLARLQANLDQISSFENTAIKNIDQVMKAAKNVPELGSKFLNTPVRSIGANVLGTKEMARLRTALATAQAESAKVLTSANLSGVLSDSARKDAKDFLDGNLPFSSMLAQADQLKTDFANRHQAYQDQINLIKGRLGNKPVGTSAPIEITLPSGKKITIQ